jgi:DNA primase
VFIFEGETDLISAASCTGVMDGFVAVPGASWVPDKKQAINLGMNRQVFLCFDNDGAGVRATLTVAAMLKDHLRSMQGHRVFTWDWDALRSSKANDISDLIAELGSKKVKKIFPLNWKEL